MPESIRASLIALSLIFFVTDVYHRIQSQRSGEALDRTREGVPLMLGIRLLGLVTFGSTAV